MVGRWSQFLSITLQLSLLFRNGAALQLEPISPRNPPMHDHDRGRAPHSALELKSAETFLWGSSTGRSPNYSEL